MPGSFRAMTSWLYKRAMDDRIRTSGCMGYLDTTTNSDAVTTSSWLFAKKVLPLRSRPPYLDDVDIQSLFLEQAPVMGYVEEG